MGCEHGASSALPQAVTPFSPWDPLYLLFSTAVRLTSSLSIAPVILAIPSQKVLLFSVSSQVFKHHGGGWEMHWQSENRQHFGLRDQSFVCQKLGMEMLVKFHKPRAMTHSTLFSE